MEYSSTSDYNKNCMITSKQKIYELRKLLIGKLINKFNLFFLILITSNDFL